MLRYMLDTNICIYVLKERVPQDYAKRLIVIAITCTYRLSSLPNCCTTRRNHSIPITIERPSRAFGHDWIS
jgi:predicted nucleic acid-binding protein